MVLSSNPQDILNTLTRTLQASFGKNNIGIEVNPTSDFYLKYVPIANMYSLVANAVDIAKQQTSELSATGSDLDDLANIKGIYRRTAQSATGFITIQCSSSTNVLAGSTLSFNGLIYSVTQPGYYSNGNSIPIQSIDTGANCNQSIGSVFTWITTPSYTSTSAVCATAITGGSDSETDASLRARLIGRLQNPASAGNSQYLIDAVLGYDPTIQAAFVYSGCVGPSTQHIAIIRSQELSSVNRDVPITPNLINLTNFILEELPGYASTVISTVTNVTYNVGFTINIPYPGAGNNKQGWYDSNPWPIRDASNTITYCSVTSVISNNNFIISSYSGSTSIVAGLTNISWIDNTNANGNGWTVYVSQITAFTDNGNNTYTVTINNPFVGILAGDYIFPASYRCQIYLNAVMNSFAGLGPGQKTNVANVLPVANRVPDPNDNIYTDIIDNEFTKAVTDSSVEITNCNFSYQQYGLNEPPLPTNLLSSPITTSTNNPSIYVPNQIGFYPTKGS